MSKRKPSNFQLKIKDLSVLTVAATIAYVYLEPRFGGLFFGLLLFVVFMIWVLFFMPTKCDFQLISRNGTCKNDVRGKLRGCTGRKHEQPKRDAVWSALRMRNPGLLFRVMWVDQGAHGTRVGGSSRSGSRPGPEQGADDGVGQRPTPTPQTASQLLMLGATLIGSLAGVLALFIR